MFGLKPKEIEEKTLAVLIENLRLDSMLKDMEDLLCIIRIVYNSKEVQ